VIPNRHVARFEDLSQEEMADMQKTIRKVDHAVRTLYGYSDYLLMQKNGPLAGQTVPHVHFHYLPGANFLTLRFLASPWFPAMSAEKMKGPKEELAKLMVEEPASRN
jgi:diadenosine tetraphosphate (Ap4A) HIT family hydrolase